MATSLRCHLGIKFEKILACCAGNQCSERKHDSKSQKAMLAMSGFLDGQAIHRALQGHPQGGRQLYFTFPSAPDPLFKASKAPFHTLRVKTFISCCRTPGPQKGCRRASEGESEGFPKGFRRVLEGI